MLGQQPGERYCFEQHSHAHTHFRFSFCHCAAAVTGVQQFWAIKANAWTWHKYNDTDKPCPPTADFQQTMPTDLGFWRGLPSSHMFHRAKTTCTRTHYNSGLFLNNIIFCSFFVVICFAKSGIFLCKRSKFVYARLQVQAIDINILLIKYKQPTKQPYTKQETNKQQINKQRHKNSQRNMNMGQWHIQTNKTFKQMITHASSCGRQRSILYVRML